MTSEPLPECTCPPENSFHTRTCPRWLEQQRRMDEILNRVRRMY